MTKTDFWQQLAERYIDCSDCFCSEDCARVVQFRTEGNSDKKCAEELRKAYERLSENEGES